MGSRWSLEYTEEWEGVAKQQGPEPCTSNPVSEGPANNITPFPGSGSVADLECLILFNSTWEQESEKRSPFIWS